MSITSLLQKKEATKKQFLEGFIIANDKLSIGSAKLRHFLFVNAPDGLIHSSDLLNDNDSEEVKAAKLKRSWPLELVVFITGDYFQEHRYEYDYDSEDDRQEIGPILKELAKEINKFVESQGEAVQKAWEEGNISFPALKVALQKRMGEIIVVNKYGKPVAGKIKECSIQSSWMGPMYLHLKLGVIVHNGLQLTESQVVYDIFEYDGKHTLESLGVQKLSDELKEQLVARGKKYYELTAKPSYVHYQGIGIRRAWWSTTRFRADGRIMVDLANFKSMDPNYSKYFADEDRGTRSQGAFPELTDELYMQLPPFVYGFSFAAKEWCEFDIDSISDIHFRTDSYEKLVLDEKLKATLFALVGSERSKGKDFIDEKGGGQIFLLAGPPGVGKTLTAEAIAEKLKRPLYMVGVGELGTTAPAMEQALRDILEIATAWNAVLLIDEADIFMEERTDLHIERNAMVGVMLRMLEYYQGILFLTTNRVSSLDKAFMSRISLPIRYAHLGFDARLAIWENIIGLYGHQDIDTKALASVDLNGRQIKQIVAQVHQITQDREYPPTTDDYFYLVNQVTYFNELT